MVKTFKRRKLKDSLQINLRMEPLWIEIKSVLKGMISYKR